MALRLVTLVLAQSLDLVTFSVMVRRVGLEAEANPLVAGLFSNHGMPALIAAKAALVILIAALAVAAAGQARSRAWAVAGGLPLALAIAFGLIGGITNTSVFLR